MKWGCVCVQQLVPLIHASCNYLSSSSHSIYSCSQPNNTLVLANKYQFLLSLVCLQFYTLTMEEKRKSRQISPTKSKPREEKIEEAQEETKPFQTNQSVLFRHISFLQSVQKGTACVCWDCAESLHCVVELHVM